MRATFLGWFASALFPLALIAAGCSKSPEKDPGRKLDPSIAPGGSAGRGSGGSAAGAGGAAGSGGGAASGSSQGGSPGAGGNAAPGSEAAGSAGGLDAAAISDSARGGTMGADASGGVAGTDTSGDVAGTDASIAGRQSFSCTLIVGCFQSSQWFDGGFETAVGNDRWEIKWEHNTFTEKWANPADPFWNVRVASPCATNATAPDRVLFVAYSMTLNTAAEWETELTRVVDNIKTKYPSAKRIDLLGMVRSPDNQLCPGNSNRSTVVSPAEDQAMQSVADKSGGLVKVGPKYFAPSCGAFVSNNTNLTGAGISAVVPMLSAAYRESAQP